MKSTKYLAWFFGLICGVELLVAIVLGGASASVVLGLEGAMVVSLLTVGSTMTILGWVYSRRKSVAT
jgi:hypothetical protein